MKMKKTIAVNIMILLVMIAMIPVTAYASLNYYNDSIVSFVREPVHRSRYGPIAPAVKSVKTDWITVTLADILKPGGDSSNYKRIKGTFLAEKDGILYTCSKASDNILKKGEDNYIMLKDGYGNSNTKIIFYAMGNNPELDCEITGVFNANY